MRIRSARVSRLHDHVGHGLSGVPWLSPDNNRMGYIARQGVSHLLAAKQRAAACTLALRLDVLGYLLQEYDRAAVLRNLTIVDDASACVAIAHQMRHARRTRPALVLDLCNNLAECTADSGRDAIRGAVLGSWRLAVRALRPSAVERSRLWDAEAFRMTDKRAAHRRVQRVLAVRSKALGDDHHWTLAARLNLANLEGVLGRFRHARALIAEVVEVRSRTVGPQHFLTLLARYFQAGLSLRERMADHPSLEPDAALEEHRSLSRDIAAALGPNHLLNSFQFGNVGVSAMFAARESTDEVRQDALRAEAQACIADAQALRRRLGCARGEPWFVLLSNAAWAQTERFPDDIDGALATYQELLEQRIAAYGPDHPSLEQTWLSIGGLQQRAGRFDASVEAYAALERIRGAAFGPASLTRWKAALLVTESLVRTGAVEACVQRVEAAIAALRAMNDAEASQMATGLHSLGVQAREAGCLDVAVPCLQVAMDTDLRLHGDQPGIAAESTVELARALDQQGRTLEATDHYDRGLAQWQADPDASDHAATIAELRAEARNRPWARG